MDWMAYDTWIVVTGALCAMSCALLGSFLVLRHMSMMGDSISHAVLPGLAAAFLLTGDRTSTAMFLGAVIVGVLTAVFTQWVHNFGRVDRGASMGIVFTTLFAIGLIMIVRAADDVDLDPGCVLYGAIELVPLPSDADLTIAGLTIPRPTFVLGIVFLINAAVVALLYKEFKISSFDPALATTLGINARVMHYLLMTLVAVTTVASFEALGSILVIAMLIVPAASAYLLTDRLGLMLLLALIIAAASAWLGHYTAITVPTWFGFVDTSTSGMMAVSAGGLFVVIALLAPRYGVLTKMYARLSLRLRIAREDVLGLLYRLEETQDQRPSPVELPAMRQRLHSTATVLKVAIGQLRRGGYVQRAGGRLQLTDRGRDRAARLVRAHRLWESYLDQHSSVPPDQLHHAAERLEHITDEQLSDALSAATKQPRYDPHGREVPPP